MKRIVKIKVLEGGYLQPPKFEVKQGSVIKRVGTGTTCIRWDGTKTERHIFNKETDKILRPNSNRHLLMYIDGTIYQEKEKEVKQYLESQIRNIDLFSVGSVSAIPDFRKFKSVETW